MNLSPALVLAVSLVLAAGLEWSRGASSSGRRCSATAAATPHRKSKPSTRSKKSAETEGHGGDGSSASATPKSKKRRPKTGDEDDDVPSAKSSTEPRSSPSPAPGKRRAAVVPRSGTGILPVTPTPTPKKRATDADEPAAAKPPGQEAATANDAAKAPSRYAPSASIPSAELKEFRAQPARVQEMLEDALSLAKLNLTYQYGSDDPANGGMDCSGAIAYLLRQHGYKDIPRDASGQYVWARQHGQFFAVISKKAGGFEFADLRPGDLMFWRGTYHVERDPPVTHSMLYLGVQRERGQQVMWGSSDGRTYDGKQRYGVSVFDFHMPRPEVVNSSGLTSDFIGYAHLPPAEPTGVSSAAGPRP